MNAELGMWNYEILKFEILKSKNPLFKYIM